MCIHIQHRRLTPMPLLILKSGILALMLVCYHISTTPPVPSATTPERAKVKTSGTVGFVEAHMEALTMLYKVSNIHLP